ncbi:MAG: CCA tRNA nucleotidyltransferase [Oscillospiraceae bacterium]
MDIYIPENVKKILNALEKSGYEAYIVGGCVRDSILGKDPRDYDVTTSALPEEVKACLVGFNVIETGLKHGTLTVVSGDDYVEVTTFRIDGEYLDHRRPESVEYANNLADDLSRRDFTINAMAYNAKIGIVDNYGGQKDLFRQVVRCVGNPCIRFDEDALRIIRALRFASELGFEIDLPTENAIHEMKNLLLNVASERLAKEFELLIMGSSPANVLVSFADVFGTLFPEIMPCVGFDQHSRYHIYDVWKHTAVAIENSVADREVRLALFFHDIAKPKCCVFDEEGSGHFPGHESESAEMAEMIMHRMNFSSETIKCVTQLIKFHYVTPIDDEKVVKKLLSAVGPQYFFKLTEMMKSDSRAKQSICFERAQILEAMEAKAKLILHNKECISISQLDIKGTDIAALGVQGSRIGEILDELLMMHIDEKVRNEKAELISAAKKLI